MTIVNTSELRGFVERIERLQNERDALSEDIKSVKQEAKDAGYSMKALNWVLGMRKKEITERAELKLYADAFDIFG